MKLSRDHLTTVDVAVDIKAAHTHPGQAHFAEPKSAHVCSQCAFFRPIVRNDQRGRCQMAANHAMKSLISMPAFPAAARACKYIALVEEPQG